MGKMGKTKFSDLKKFQKKLSKLSQKETDQFFKSTAKHMAARILAKVIRATPVDQGVLRRGWTAKTQSEAENRSDKGEAVKKFSDSLSVTKQGSLYIIEIINPVSYTVYVEYGHRTRDRKGFVKGRFMLTISEKELKKEAPAILEQRLEQFLKGVFKGAK